MKGSAIARAAKKSVASNAIYQFETMLENIKPPIWRRIQVADCTLDRFHEYIQTTMGSTNSHLHEFKIGSTCYGDPQLLNDGFGDDADIEDSLKVKLGKIMAGKRKGFKLRYTYDFGDGWDHVIEIEGEMPAEPKVKYPRCIDGKRACPPEDCGGPQGYAEQLTVLSDPKHDDYEEIREWAGQIDPEEFSATDTTKAMGKGTIDWRAIR